jgi:sodium transport system permease protein
MNWSNVLLILKREIRDQLRDRRTLFMIFVLPVLLYPLLGLTFIQLGQLAREEPTKVMVIGRQNLPAEPALIQDVTREEGAVPSARFIATEGELKADIELLDIEFPPQGASTPDALQEQLDEAQERLRAGECQVVLYFPPDFGRRLDHFRHRVSAADAKLAPAQLDVPKPQIFHNTAKRKSAMTYGRVRRVMEAWREVLVKQNLKAAGLPETAALPFRAETHDVADSGLEFASIWSAVLPFMMLIWALTGAFYPAIDLCAGEKERGTLETLLSSPAERGEIVAGKLLTVMLFSMGTVLLNIAAVGGTGALVISQLPLSASRAIGPPPPLAYVWILLAMVPVSALFSALCLAFAAFARSNKEGQYYLMPLFLVTFPLVLLPMQPGFELSLGTSLVPLTGIVLVLKSAIEGDYAEAAKYFLPTAAVTAICCLLAIRWAIDQFNKESVLFRESERFSLGVWLRHLVRDRQATPGVAAAVMCCVLILSVKFLLGGVLVNLSPDGTMKIVLPLIVCVLAPALLMTAVLARSPTKTLLLRWPRWWTLPGAVALAALLHPLSMHLAEAIRWLYPTDPRVEKAAEEMLGQVPSFAMLFLVVAIIGPVCEEVAFRGFILSGYRHLGRRWMAIVLSSVFFGIAHPIIQQSLFTFLLGMLIAFVAIQTGSLLPAILFHVTHNGLAIGLRWLTDWAAESVPPGAEAPWPQWLVQRILGAPSEAGQSLIGAGWLYHWGSAAVLGLFALLLLRAFARLKHEQTEEETLQEALRRQGTSARGMQAIAADDFSR